MANPLVSIIVPIWNGEAWVEDAIKSVLAQTYEQWELLLIDNGSTDESARIISSFKDERIRTFSQPHAGVSKARNLGLDNVKGEFVCFLDCDDQLPPSSLQSRVAVFESSPTTAFVDGNVAIWNDSFQEKLSVVRPTFSGQPQDELVQLNDSCFHGITWMIRQNLIGDSRFQEQMSHSEDLAFYLSISAKGGTYDYVPDVVYSIRKRAGSAMSNLDGLAEGYALLFRHIEEVYSGKINWKPVFKHKVKRILVRSFLKKGQLWKALYWSRHWR